MRSLFSTAFLIFAAASVCAAQSSTGASQGSQSQSQAAPPPASASSGQAATPQNSASTKNATKPVKKKKVWTEDDLSKGSGGISVVGDSSSAASGDAKQASETNGTNTEISGQNSDLQAYREQLRQLQAQLDATNQKLDELRNFKGDNGSASGGINPNHGYSMTPVTDQIKQLEDKKSQIQSQIDNVMDEARRKGIEPGQLR